METVEKDLCSSGIESAKNQEDCDENSSETFKVMNINL
jgi:hypothetical protein